MSEYKTIRGGKVKNYTTDPDNPYAGQVWFNETEGELRVRKSTLTSAWATGGNLNTARDNMRGAGTQTAAIGFGGGGPNAQTEQYNGSSWTEVNDLNTARGFTGRAGATDTAALCIGDNPVSGITESWNGSAWTEVNDLNTARYGSAGAGTSTDALAFGGEVPPNNFQNITESWNGTNWSNVASMNTDRAYFGGVGTGTAGLAFGGQQSTADTAATEEWYGNGLVTTTVTTTSD